MNRSILCEALPDPDRRAFFTHTAMVAAAGVAAAAGLRAAGQRRDGRAPPADQSKYMEEATSWRPSRSRRAGAARSAR